MSQDNPTTAQGHEEATAQQQPESEKKMVFRVTFEATEDDEEATGAVNIKCCGDAPFLLDAMARVLTAISKFCNVGVENIMKSELAEKVQNITKDLAHKQALSTMIAGLPEQLQKMFVDRGVISEEELQRIMKDHKDILERMEELKKEAGLKEPGEQEVVNEQQN